MTKSKVAVYWWKGKARMHIAATDPVNRKISQRVFEATTWAAIDMVGRLEEGCFLQMLEAKIRMFKRREKND